MVYLIKVNSTRMYVLNFHKKDGVLKATFHKNLKSAKKWKTEQGVKNALLTFLNQNPNENINDYLIIKRSESEFSKEETIEDVSEIKNTPIIENKNLIYKLKSFYIKIKDYIKEKIKFYFPI